MLLSKSVGLSGFWVLFSITLFGGLFGIVGILIGVPVFAVIYDLIKRWVYMMLERHNVTKYLPKKKDLDTAGN
jgi:predicted PurR-regulated permease PerM